jgi:acetoacetyl-CoA synthetase
MSWEELGAKVRILATQLRGLGVKPGDRVASCMPNIPETVIAMLATTGIGAIWTSCSPDFGAKSVLERFSQIEPKVLFCVDGYRYGGKDFNRNAIVGEIITRLDSLEHVIYLPYLDEHSECPHSAKTINWHELLKQPPVAAADFEFEQVPFDHPLWILFTSGTTGLPKPIVQGHGGITLEMLKYIGLHLDIKQSDCLFFFTTTGWMSWNTVVSTLIGGARVVLYDGHPTHPDADVLWRMAADIKMTVFGCSPTYVSLLKKLGVVPNKNYDLSRLREILMSGSPVSSETMAWFYQNVKEDLWVVSASGGTDICSAIVGGSIMQPVYAGEIQARCLGVDTHTYNEDGEKIVDEVGEHVILQPMPSMPLYFWNDTDFQRYNESYFEDFPGVWRQGDFIKFNSRGGSYVYGRSDSTLNRFGVRIGTAEIYRAIETLKEIDDSLIVNLNLPDGKYFMPLFVKLSDTLTLNDELKEKICKKLRTECSPRHVPDEIIHIEDIPYTLTGKKLEIPVRKILLGMPVEKAANPGAMANPQSLDYFIEYSRHHADIKSA